MDAEDVAGGVCFGGSEVWVAVSGPVQVLATRAATIKHLWVDRRQKVDLVHSASSYPFLHRSPGGTSKAQRYRVTRNRHVFFFVALVAEPAVYWKLKSLLGGGLNFGHAVVYRPTFLISTFWFLRSILYCLYCTIIVFRVGIVQTI